MSEPFIAEVRIFAGNFAPRGWAFCDGQLLPIAQNTALFSLIGTTYGGDGRTTTGLPNLKGRLPMHPGRGPGLTSRRLGEEGGTEHVSLTQANLPGHTHAMAADPAPGVSRSPSSGDSIARSLGSNAYGAASGLVPMAPETIVQEGGSQPHDNMQPFLAMYFIIALSGQYPSRA